MIKDIFIDNVIVTRHFSNPPKRHYKKLIAWLRRFDVKQPHNNAYLVVSNKLLAEYYGTCSYSNSGINMPTIIDMLTRQGRLNRIKNDKIKGFKQKYFKKHIKLRCNPKDKNHIPIIMLSHRKYALTADGDFCYDINHFPRFGAKAACGPQHLPYDG